MPLISTSMVDSSLSTVDRAFATNGFSCRGIKSAILSSRTDRRRGGEIQRQFGKAEFEQERIAFRFDLAEARRLSRRLEACESASSTEVERRERELTTA